MKIIFLFKRLAELQLKTSSVNIDLNYHATALNDL
jgi:hypothetical protein